MSRFHCPKCGALLSKREPFEVGELYDEDERICHNCDSLYVVDDGELHYCGDLDDLDD